MSCFTDEQVEFIVKEIMAPCMQEQMKAITEAQDYFTEKMCDSIVTSLANEIAKINYENQKNMSFIKAVLTLNKFSDNEHYQNYCKEYDRLNKHLLDEKLKEKFDSNSKE